MADPPGCLHAPITTPPACSPAEIKLGGDYKKGSSATVWLKGGNALNGHHGAGGQAAADEWPQDELGDSNVADLGDLEVRCCCPGC